MTDYRYAPFKAIMLRHDECVGVLSLYNYGASYPRQGEQIQIQDDIYIIDNVRHVVERKNSAPVIHLYVSKVN